MSYSLKNFEKHFPPEILIRGKKYWDKGAVLETEEEEESSWIFTIEGTEIYKVNLQFNNKWKLEYSICNCPFFEENDFCKHEVAALYSLQATRTINIVESKEKKGGKATPHKLLNDALQSSSKEIIAEFMSQYANYHKEFLSHFLLFIKHKKAEETEDYKAYGEIILEALATAKGKSAYWESEQLKVLSKTLKPFAEKLTLAMREKNYILAFPLASAFISSLSLLVHSINNISYSSRIIEMSTAAYQALRELLKAEVAWELKGNIRDWVWEEMQNEKLHFLDQKEFCEIGSTIIQNKEQEANFLAIVNQKIKANTTQKSGSTMRYYGYNDGKEKPFLDVLVSYYKKTGNEEAALSIVLSNAENYQEYFEYSLAYWIKTGDFQKAEKALSTRIKQYPYLANKYLPVQLDLALRLKHKESILTFSIQLYQQTGKLEYYETYKMQFSIAEWENEQKTYIAKIEKSYIPHKYVLVILIKEGLLEESLLYLKNSKNLELLANFAAQFYATHKSDYYYYFLQAIDCLFPKRAWSSPKNSDYKKVVRALSILKKDQQEELVDKLVLFLTSHHQPKRNLMALIQPFIKSNKIVHT